MMYHGIFLVIVGLSELALGWYVLRCNPKASINKSYALLVLAVLFWVFANMAVVFVRNPEAIEQLFRITYVAGVWIAVTFLLFVWHFPYTSVVVGWKRTIALILPASVLSIVLLFTNIIVTGHKAVWWGAEAVLSDWFICYLIYFVGYFLWAYYTLYKKFISSDGVHKGQIKLVFFSTAIPFIIALIFDVILPWRIEKQFLWTVFFGSEASIVWMGITGYMVFRK